MEESFGELLCRFRLRAGLSQRDLADREVGLSASYIAMLERQERGHARPHRERGQRPILTRVQIWYLIKNLKLWPPECDKLLEGAGHDTDRSHDEELDLQRRVDLFHELWVFARIILDPERPWFDRVAENILTHGVTYRYFTEREAAFHNFLKKMQGRAGPRSTLLSDRLQCILLPKQLFVTNFAIYNPGLPNMYCCGAKPVSGKAEAFYTMHVSEATRLYEFLREVRDSLAARVSISLSDVREVYPTNAHSPFAPLGNHISDARKPQP